MEWSPRTLKCETPALQLPSEHERFALERDATLLIATLPAGDRSPVVMPGLDFTNRYHAIEVKPDPITRVRLHLEPMTDHDRAMTTAVRERRWNERDADDRKRVTVHRAECRPYGVRSQGAYGFKVAPVPCTTSVVAGQCLIPLTVTEYRTVLVNGGYAWVGHRRVEVGSKRVSVARKIARVRRQGATGKRGRVVSWWSMSAKSLPRAWSKASEAQRATAGTLESIIRTSVRDVSVSLADGHAVIFDGATVRRDEPASRTMPVREYARRAALAGLVID